jgi:hypothetical protein
MLVMPSTILIFDEFPPNPNSRRHFMKISSDNKYWKELAFYTARQAHAPLREKAHLHYHFSTGDRRAHDMDNLIASTKPLSDGLKGVAIVDDSIDHITVEYTFDRKKPRQIVLTIT